MKPLNLNQAAKTCKKSKAAILEAIRSGRLSAKQNDFKIWEIDPAELFRVYPFEIETDQPTSKSTTKQNRDQPDENQQVTNDLFKEIIEQIEKERTREREQMQTTIDDLRKRLDEESQERKKLTQLLLTHQPEPTKQKKENLLFKKIFRK
jgi:hypothetical protein